jgi:RNA polymerase sigma-70 factor (ECF subfamily)
VTLALPALEPAPELDDLNQRCLAWLAQVARGDHSAFEALYAATTARMWPLALRIVGQPAAAEDVLSELYFQVWRDAASFDLARSAPLGWMTVICRSRALDHLRRRERAESCGDMEALAELSARSEAAHEAGECIDEAGAARERTQNLDRLDQALSSLPALRRQMLSLACFRGLSHSDLAAHFELPLGTVKSHMRAALAHARQCLAQGEA